MSWRRSRAGDWPRGPDYETKPISVVGGWGWRDAGDGLLWRGAARRLPHGEYETKPISENDHSGIAPLFRVYDEAAEANGYMVELAGGMWCEWRWRSEVKRKA